MRGRQNHVMNQVCFARPHLNTQLPSPVPSRSLVLIYTTASIHKTPPSHFGSKLRGYQQLGRMRRESCRLSAATVDNVQKLSLFRVVTLFSFVYETGWRSIRQ